MQFEHRNKRLRLLAENGGQKSNPYPYWINFYTTPPDYKVSLQEIEDMVSERLKILAVFDNLLRIKEKSRALFDAINSQICSIKCENNEKNFYVAGRSESIGNRFEARKRDHISHFLLRIYYCQNEELRRWFISRESELLRIRFIESSFSDASSLEECLLYYGYKYEIVSMVDNHDLFHKVDWAEYNRRNQQQIAFKLKFEEAFDLMRFRKVYLHDGYAYIGSNEIISVLCQGFKTNLSRELTRMHSYFYSFGEERLIWRLESLHHHYILNAKSSNRNNSQDNDNGRERIHLNEINELSRNMFPPCMRSIHDRLRRDHHLKHYGRLYYGLYLKAAGLSMDDSMEFFRNELSITNPEKFQKEYSYTIRYIYGKAGKRVQLSAYKCHKIINDNAPGPNDTHGCPFRHFDVKNLKALLVRYGVNNDNDLEEIVQKVTEDKNYTGACGKYFSIKYGQDLPDQSVYHPNQFFIAARRAINNPVQCTTDVVDTSLPQEPNVSTL
ncbi:DNA primase large subunit [Dermatophagoides farinae]|uniref:DNA primase large subunit n=1 Tax=Dermatophagoides farinae TaxID=6954 RepID=A0A922HMU9_DERFA|nr:DNA primase large subunit-like [Dermatophagoides farinae]KAH7644162.1 dna primase large subunit-like protein [Dermatophagoides farinae]KAH9493972.1 DNA primase large subunit [Dermatophagoides farinae]